jgi:hypothetical protein
VNPAPSTERAAFITVHANLPAPHCEAGRDALNMPFRFLDET